MKRLLFLCTALGVVLLLGVPRRAAAQAPAPGPPAGGDLRGHVDVGGRRLYLECAGAGGPSVVLEAGLGFTHETWARVQPELAALTRVCSYDRAGLGQSDPPPDGLRTAGALAADLDALLTAAGVPAPYVLVAHSIGGHVALLYAARRPDRVAGVVLVDAPSETYTAGLLPRLEPAARADLLRTFGGENPERLDILASHEELRAAPPPPAVPLALLTRTIRAEQPNDEYWRAMQIALAGRLGASPHAYASNSAHNIQRDQPELVLDAVRAVVGRARAAAGPRGLPRTGQPGPAPSPPAGVLGAALVVTVAGLLARTRQRGPSA